MMEVDFVQITYFSSPVDVLRELGKRVKETRIAMDMTQKDLAGRTNLSLRTICNLESGKDVSLLTLIEVLRALNRLQGLEVVIPDQGIRPSQIAALGKPRERVRKKSKPQNKSGWTWGDE